MVWHGWRCECGTFMEQIGIMSLSLAIRTHESLIHGQVTPRTRTLQEIESSHQYSIRQSLARADASVPYSEVKGSATPTLEEHKWLQSQHISWGGDHRSEEELAVRYKEHQ